MEGTLLSPHSIQLGRQGIPLSLISHLVKSGKFYDVNLRQGFGSDPDLAAIHELESSLGTLSHEDVERRIAADFCCIWRYDYPGRVHEICSIIGGSSHTALRLHYQVSPGRRQELIDYAEALKGWVHDAAPQDVDGYGKGGKHTIDKVYAFLGEKTPLKALLAERTYYGLSRRSLNCSFWGINEKEPRTCLAPFAPQQLPHEWQERMAYLENEIHRQMGRAARDFLCDVGGSSEPACHFKFVRRIDILVSSIGCMQWRGNLPPKDGAVSGRRRITASYLAALEQYWRGTPADADDQDLAVRLSALLGSPTDCKRWLAACLWKNIKNQTLYQAYPMRHWVDFVRIGEDYIDRL
ncbi:MAG: hypothetical protein JW832_06870 [Deltaproteobacteria bacterium]|nr:hypothetical protein [Deltaproteobacteria bacterium]